MKKIISSLFAVFLVFFAVAAGASAHVKVTPAESGTGAYETYTMKVPNEKDNPTLKIVLKTPKGAEFESYEPVAGWQVTPQKDANGKVTSVTWTATKGGIQPGQFLEFNFIAKNPAKATTLVWNAYQYYQDKSIVEWTGNEKSQTPHATTVITKSAAGEGENAHGQSMNMKNMGSMSHDSNDNKTNNTLLYITLILSIAAIVLSVIALAVKKKK